MASLLLEHLASKAAVDDAIRLTKDKVVVLRFGRSTDLVCMQQDDIVRVQGFGGVHQLLVNRLQMTPVDRCSWPSASESYPGWRASGWSRPRTCPCTASTSTSRSSRRPSSSSTAST